MSCRHFLILACLVSGLAASATAQPLSRKTDIDFFRDVPSRNLKGLATRSDGRLVGGPTLTEWTTPPPADLLWTLEPTREPAKWLVGTGPDGRVVELTLNFEQSRYTARDVAKFEDPQVFALKQLADGSILAGTSPNGALYLVRDEKTVARALLPVDSIFDLALLDEHTALAATGNPARIYRIDLQKFAAIGLIVDKITDTNILAERGITLFGEVRDRNVRRVAVLSDGRVAAGSAPRGNVYSFPRGGGAPVILQENRDAEVTDLVAGTEGDFHATLVYAPTSGEARITPPPSAAKGAPRETTPPPAQVERFAGRSALVWFPADGFPETIAARANTAFYRVARHGDMLIMAAGEQGELMGFDRRARLSHTFAGSVSSQLNGIAPLPGMPGKFLILRNNAPGLAVLDFSVNGPREAETRRLDLGTPAQLGALRFNRLRNLDPDQLTAEVRVSNGSDEVEGWGPWSPLVRSPDGGWRGEALRGRYVKLRLKMAPPPPGAAADATLVQPAPAPARGGARTASRTASAVPAGPPAAVSPSPAPAASLEVDRAALFALPQNRRPQLQDFRVLAPGYSVIPAPETPPSATVSLSRLMEAAKEPERRPGNFLSSQVVPSRGAQVVVWTVTDPDGDNIVSTFSIRRDGQDEWVDVAASTRESYVQFDTAHLPDGVYFTRLVSTEVAPRRPADRLSQTFETDDLIVDHTPPELIDASAQRVGDSIVVTVRGRDQLSLLQGMEVVFNNGVRETVEQPVDGVRDGREETFRLDLPLARVSNATSVEVTIYDAAGNGSARRLTW